MYYLAKFQIYNYVFMSHFVKKDERLGSNRERCTFFEVRHPRCLSQNHKIRQQTLESQNATILYYIHIANDGNT